MWTGYQEFKKIEKSRMTSCTWLQWLGEWCLSQRQKMLSNKYTYKRRRKKKLVFEMLNLATLIRYEATVMVEHLLDIVIELMLCVRAEPRGITHVPDGGRIIPCSLRDPRNLTWGTHKWPGDSQSYLEYLSREGKRNASHRKSDCKARELLFFWTFYFGPFFLLSI